MDVSQIIKKNLDSIMAIPSPTGDTDELMLWIMKEFNSLNLKVKSFYNGAIRGTFQANFTPPSITIMAHGDTLGAMVRSISEDGKIGLSKLGGYYWEAHHGENAYLKTAFGNIFSGTILYKEASYHINKEAMNKRWDDQDVVFRLDQKVFSKSDVNKLGINRGDFIYFDPRTTWVNGFVKSRFLDDKAGLAVLLTLCHTISTQNINLQKPINFIVTTTEEIGLGGAVGVPSNTSDLIAIDMGVVGEQQYSDEFSVTICSKDSAAVYNKSLREKLTDIAVKNEIPHHVDVFYHYGSDIYPALLSGQDVRAALIGPGIHNSHGYERTHLDSMQATHDLILNYLMEPLPDLPN